VLFSGLLDGHGNKVGGKLFKLLPILDGLLEFGSISGRNPLTEVGAVVPDLVFEIGARLPSGRRGAILGFNAAELHGIDRSHLSEDGRAFGGSIKG
jgi:hypothetical protein